MTAILLNHHVHAQVYAFIGQTWEDACRQAGHFCLTDLQKNWRLDLPHLRTAARKIIQSASEGNWENVVVQYVESDPDSITYLYGGDNHFSVTADPLSVTQALTPATTLNEENLEQTLDDLRTQTGSPSQHNKHPNAGQAKPRKPEIDMLFQKAHNHDLHHAHWQDPFRIESVFHLGTQLFQSQPHEETLEAVKELLNGPDGCCFDKQHWFMRLQEIQQHDLTVLNLKELHLEILELASEHGTGMGFLLKLQPKAPTGEHTTQWAYGETLSEALENARKSTIHWPGTHPERSNQVPKNPMKGNP